MRTCLLIVIWLRDRSQVLGQTVNHFFTDNSLYPEITCMVNILKLKLFEYHNNAIQKVNIKLLLNQEISTSLFSRVYRHRKTVLFY